MFWSSLQPVVAMAVAAAVVVVMVVCVCVSDNKGPDTDMLGIKLLSNLKRDNVKMMSRLPGCIVM
jgi:hypothetical protein